MEQKTAESSHHLLIFAREPVLGRVKTRLAADIGPEAALEVYRELLALTAAAVTATEVPATVWLAEAPHPTADAALPRPEWPGLPWRVQPPADLLGERMAKRHILAGIYALRSVAIVLFVALPLTPWSVYVFASAMGLLWLSTVPTTNALIAQIFGLRYMSMLGGFVFLSHQIGAFMGAWLGGRLFDLTGSYTAMWWLSVALGLFAAIMNLPVRETPIMRATPQPA